MRRWLALVSLVCVQLVVRTQADCTVPSYPPDKRVVRASVAVKAIITEKTEAWAELWIIYAYKGGEKLASYAGLSAKHLADKSIRDIRVNVSTLSECTGLELTKLKQEYIVLLQPKGHRLYLDPNPGGIIPFSSQIDSRIYKLLGWGDWTEWSSCSAICEGGEQSRQRRCVSGSCSSHDRETRECNLFTCRGLINLLSVDNPSYFKPQRNNFRKIPGRSSGWRLKSASYLLYPFKEAYGTEFPREFALFLNFKPYKNTEGVLLSLTNPRDKTDFISLELTNLAGQSSLAIKLVHSTTNGTRVVAIPADVEFNRWNYLALSLGEKTTIKTYLNCNWVSTQMLDGYPMLAHRSPDIAIGYLFQGEIEQVSVSSNLEDVSKQCSTTKPNHSSGLQIEPVLVSDDEYNEEEFVILNKNSEQVTKADAVDEGSGREAVPLGKGDTIRQDEEEEEGSGESERFLVEWSSWSPCGASCGRSIQTRSSRCQDSEHMMECIDAGYEKRVTRSCSGPPCPGTEFEAGHITPEDIIHFRTHFTHNNNNTDEEDKAVDTSTKENRGDYCGCSSSTARCNKHKSGCVCLEGWSGQNCTSPVCTPSCKQGTCVQPNVCACRSGYTGARCQKAFCEHECENGGRCVAPFSCKCQPQYYGEYCQHRLCSFECRNGGICVAENLCSCPHGFSGSDCGDFTCSQRCQHGGICTAPDQCTCRPGYTGRACSTKVCSKYVHKKVPVRKAYKRVVSVRGGEMTTHSRAVPRTFYRTYYKTVLRCADPEY